MKRLKIFIAFALFTTLSAYFISCSKDNSATDESTNLKLRENFLKGKSYREIKNSYMLLSADEKKGLWNEKLDQLLMENLPLNVDNYIVSLKNEINKPSVDIEKISNVSINLANIIPEKDFLEMFVTLNDYNYKNRFVGKTKVSGDILLSLKSIPVKMIKSDVSQQSDNQSKLRPSCNCKWTCSAFSDSSSAGDNCSMTTSGCGFMWFFECTSHA